MATPKQERGETGDPFNLVHSARIRKGKVEKYSSQELPWHAVSMAPFERDKPPEATRRRPSRKIHPSLRDRIKSSEADRTETVLIRFQEHLIVPRFPEPETEEPPTSRSNKRLRVRAQSLAQEVADRRASAYERLTRDLAENFQAKVVETFWLIHAVLAEIPLGKVDALLKRDDVVYVEPRLGGEEPPADVATGRGLMSTDPYFGLGLTGGWIGLLDTGLRFSHTLFNSPSTIAFRRDCVLGGADCNTGTGLNPSDDCWNHGTSTAAIITGNGKLGDGHRGVTAITLDSFKVYPDKCGGLDAAAVVRGFQAAVAVLDRVLVAEMQGSGDDLSSISAAADAAFDAGAVVIAANGNNGPAAGTVNAPANARKVIGVGDFDADTQAQITSQSRGPTRDNRFKPDIQTPTNTETASNASDTALRVFSGTSGATPYAAGAAALVRNWLRGTSFSIDPGQVYAFLILAGQHTFPFDNTVGAGPLRLPTNGWAWWGKVSLGSSQTIDIPISISGAKAHDFDGALWWPETTTQHHNDVDLYLLDPAGASRASSLSISSVFERARVSGPVSAGSWTLRIRAYNVTGTQTVYWAAHVVL